MRRIIVLLAFILTTMESCSQQNEQTLEYKEIYAFSLNAYISELKKNRDSLMSSNIERDIKLSKYYETILTDTKYVLNEGNLDNFGDYQIQLDIKTIDKFQLSKLLSSSKDVIDKIIRVGHIKPKGDSFVISVGLFSPHLDKETQLLMFGSSGTTLIRYGYNCDKNTFFFKGFGNEPK